MLEDLISARKRAKADLKKETDPFKRAVLDGRQLALKVVYRIDPTLSLEPCSPFLDQRKLGVWFHRGNDWKTPLSSHLVECDGIRSTNDREDKSGVYHLNAYGETNITYPLFDLFRKLRLSIASLMAIHITRRSYTVIPTPSWSDLGQQNWIRLWQWVNGTVLSYVRILITISGSEAADLVTKKFVKPIKLEFEKVYYPYLLINKKRYAGLYWTKPEKYDKMDSKGIEVRCYPTIVCTWN